MVVVEFVEVEDSQALVHQIARVIAESDLHTVTHQRMLLPVGVDG